MSCNEVLEKVNTLLKDFSSADGNIDWYNDDTAWCIEVCVSKASSSEHARMLNTMIKNGFTLFDFANNTEEDDNPIHYSAVYWFN